MRKMLFPAGNSPSAKMEENREELLPKKWKGEFFNVNPIV